MNATNISILLFTAFAIGLPVWGMFNNPHHQASVHGCTGSCYEQWREETGGVLAMAEAAAAARAEASPAELGAQLYAGCVACHGAAGEAVWGRNWQGSPGRQSPTNCCATRIVKQSDRRVT